MAIEYDYEKDGKLMSRRCLYTNADRIRSMTDKELAEFSSKKHPLCPEHAKESCAGMVSIAKCEKCWLDWLKQEATTDG